MPSTAPINMRTKADLGKLRRIAISAQGLNRTAAFGKGVPGTLKAITHLGYVQIDTISVVERAHHHVLHSRVPNYKPNHLNKLLKDRSIFEYWSHAAAFLPTQDFRFSLPLKAAIRAGEINWIRSRDAKLMQQLLEQIQSDGPLRSRDVAPDSKPSQGGGWWDWKPAKQALEQLYMQGDLMVTSRDGFQKTYDLPERVLPSTIDTTPPSPEEYAHHLFDQALRCHGFVSQKGMTYLRRNTALRQAAKSLLEDKLANQELITLRIKGSPLYYLDPALLDGAAPSTQTRVTILSPFDNTVIQRDRLQDIFDYDYQIECYVPEAKRQFGYFCLPLLYRDQFIGRMDCKVHRQRRHLEIRSLHLEFPDLSDEQFPLALVTAIDKFSDFQNADDWSVTHCSEPKLIAKMKHFMR